MAGALRSEGINRAPMHGSAMHMRCAGPTELGPPSAIYQPTRHAGGRVEHSTDAGCTGSTQEEVQGGA